MFAVHDGALRLSYFPALLPDELLCSYLGRLAAFNGLGATRFYENFIGRSGTPPTIDLPTNLDSLQLRLNKNSPFCSLDDLIARSTVYPYHRAFLGPEKDRQIESLLRSGRGSAAKAALGRIANRFGANPRLRYCLDCVEHDYDNYGSPYWHRVHQLPGVTVCVEHDKCLLSFASEQNLVRKTNLPLPPITRNPDFRAASIPLQREFASLSAQVLMSGPVALDPERIAETYRAEAISQGFHIKGRINFGHLTVGMRKYFDDFASFVHRERLLSTTQTPLAWLHPLLHRPLRSSHPICHLLLIWYLFGTLEKFMAAVNFQRESASITASESVRKATQPDAEVELLNDKGRSCRSIAKELGVSVTTVVLRRQERNIGVHERHKTLTAETISKIVAAIKQQLPLAEIATNFGVSISTVYRQRRVHHLHLHSATKQFFALKRTAKRAEWIRAVEGREHGSMGRVRDSVKGAYSWLYRNDRSWLHANCAPRSHPKTHRPTVNWGYRDNEFSETLRKYVALLTLSKNRPRISKTLMLNQIGDAVVRKNRGHLPKTYDVLAELEEPVLSHQIWRLDRAIASEINEGFPVKIWKIRRSAGIRKWDTIHEKYVISKIYPVS